MVRDGIMEISMPTPNCPQDAYDLDIYRTKKDDFELVKKYTGLFNSEDIKDKVSDFLLNFGGNYKYTLSCKGECHLPSENLKGIQNILDIHNKALENMAKGYATQDLD